MPDEIQPEPRRRRRDEIQEDVTEDDRPRRRRRREDDDEDDDRFRKPDAVESLIPYRNPKALTAYYLGVFSLIPCLGAFLGPAALILGVLGLSYHKTHRTAGGTGHAIAGVVLGSLTTLGNWGMIITLLVAGFLG